MKLLPLIANYTTESLYFVLRTEVFRILDDVEPLPLIQYSEPHLGLPGALQEPLKPTILQQRIQDMFSSDFGWSTIGHPEEDGMQGYSPRNSRTGY